MQFPQVGQVRAGLAFPGRTAVLTADTLARGKGTSVVPSRVACDAPASCEGREGFCRETLKEDPGDPSAALGMTNIANSFHQSAFSG